MPALIVVLLVSALVMGPLVSSLAPGEYFKHPGTWTYVLRNALMVPEELLVRSQRRPETAGRVAKMWRRSWRRLEG